MTSTLTRPSTPQHQNPEDLGALLVRLLDTLETADIFFVARDELRGAELASALAAAAPEAVVAFCPGSDALPGEASPPSPANAGQRVAALRKIRAASTKSQRPHIALVTTGEAAARAYPPPADFEIAPPVLRAGAACDLDALAAQLESVGYVPDDRVDEPGEIAVRGQVLDVYPADADGPYRIEVQDGSIAFIRPYDPVTQLTHGECEHLEVGRATEPEIGAGATLLDHLPAASIAWDNGADERRRRFLALAADTTRRAPKRAGAEICVEDRWREAEARHPELPAGDGLGVPPPRFVEAKNPSRAFSSFARAELGAGHRLVLLGTARDLRFLSRRVAKLLKIEPVQIEAWKDIRAAASGSVLLLEVPLQRGLRIGDIIAVAASDLLGSRAGRDDHHATMADADLFRLGEIKVGDVVVHEEHGICTIAGLETLPSGGDAIVLRFAADTRRLVPVSEAHRIWRYGAEESAVTLDKLDGSTWEKRRGEIEAAIAQSARGLIALADERGKRTAPFLEPDAAAYERFAAGFPFTETPDQARSIAAVQSDFRVGRPMDRLVVGDVGFGKTEVALRAAAIAALAGKQVVVAAPTTVLVRQHLETFRERFRDSGIEIAGLSRLSTSAEKKQTIAGLKDGSIQIVIGTGGVAGHAVEYRDLALVIIDEEQRFGAADKAKLRDRASAHVLTLSATPIPRTLQRALVGLQQLSIIATPPARRQPIRTTVAAFDEQTLRTALLREKSRGGQSFVVVPRIEDLADMSARLGWLVPELELLEAHGKLPPVEIDEAMVRFARGDGDVLLATNIIEAGLDVPRANTMVVWRADLFGLSQLHQLRGRVGRGGRRGQIYLLTEAGAEIAPRTLSRLKTLQAFDRLGAGFAISARDLDTRGAGDLLGQEQAGHVKLIGIDLYQHLLELALREAKGEPVDDWTPELNLDGDGRLSEDWIADENIRIGLYSRLARLRDMADLESFEEELADRFGEPPAEARQLLTRGRLQILARLGDVEKLDAGPAALAVTLRKGAKLSGAVSDLTEKNGRWLRIGDYVADGARLEAAEELLGQLSLE